MIAVATIEGKFHSFSGTASLTAHEHAYLAVRAYESYYPGRVVDWGNRTRMWLGHKCHADAVRLASSSSGNCDQREHGHTCFPSAPLHRAAEEVARALIVPLKMSPSRLARLSAP